jgi:predicted aspartyl protease
VNYPFQSRSGPILVEAEVTGPACTLPLQLILDTGATTTLINRDVLISLGFDLASPSNLIKMTTGSTVELVPRVLLTRLTAFGQHRFGFPVLAHALPESAQVLGLLGLDFLRGLELKIDFRSGQIDLT